MIVTFLSGSLLFKFEYMLLILVEIVRDWTITTRIQNTQPEINRVSISSLRSHPLLNNTVDSDILTMPIPINVER